ncbi:M23 family metallopeptidase [Luteimonas suaedae]|uniref:M23 family metallopeptidase n=1 Tax=Luteimonas suaedae TaxID=2605430 RepID=UPI0011F04A99|nr:M23 family metallopeptidase [Luteimonas suaedae]
MHRRHVLAATAPALRGRSIAILVLALAAVALVVATSPAANTAGTPAGAAAAATPLRQSFDMQVPAPPTPVTVAGKPQLVYELHLTNFTSAPLVLQQVDVLDARDATVIAAVRDDALDRRLHRPHAPAGSGPRTIAPGMRGVLYFELAIDGDTLPRLLEHRIAFHDAGRPAQAPAIVRGGRVAVRTGAPVVLGPPLRDGPWAAVYDPSWERGHRRVVYAFEGRARIPDRFAIDWVKLDAGGRRAHGDEDAVGNWYGYGADVLAVADAVVVATRNDIPESATLSGRLQYRFEDGAGNHVVLDLGDDRYAFYKHLKPGSVRVAPGERVRRGQVIGAVGFSGHAGGPQLHFHVADADSPLGAAEGLPFALADFEVLGAYEDFDTLGRAPWTPLGDEMAARRTRELPAPITVVAFGTHGSQ